MIYKKARGLSDISFFHQHIAPTGHPSLPPTGFVKERYK